MAGNGAWKRGRPMEVEKTMTEEMTKEWVEKTLDYGETQSLESRQTIDRSSLDLVELKNVRDSLTGELREKDQSIAMWKKHENDYQNQISELTKRMDEMSKMIRNRDFEIEKSKMRESKYKQEIDVLTVKANNKGRARVPDHKLQYPQPIVSKSNPGLKLPTLVKHIMDSDEGGGSKPGKRKDRALNLFSSSPTDDFQLDGKAKKIRTDSSFGPRNVQPCYLCEKWVSKTGGKINLPNVNLVIPPKAVDSGPLLITATELQRRTILKEKLASTGLNKYIQPCVAMVLQPHGYEFMRPVKIELKNVRLGSEKILVFHKDVNHHRKTSWMDVTTECAPKNTKDGIILTTRQFCVLETIKLLLPAVTLPAQVSAANAGLLAGQNLQSIAISTHVLSILHDRITTCEFHVFHDKMEDCISVICLKADSSGDHPRDLLNLTDLRDRRAHLVPLGTGNSTFQVCDKERLFCYFEKKAKFECSFVFRLDEAESKGQLVMIPLSSNNPGKIPRKLTIRRKVADFVEDTEIAILKLTYPPAGGTTSLSESLTLENVLSKMRKKILVNVDVRFLLDMMRTEKVFTIQEQDLINQEKTRQARAKVFLDMMAQKGKRGMHVFCGALKDDYRQLAEEILELMKEEPGDGDSAESDTASTAAAVPNNSRTGQQPVSNRDKSNTVRPPGSNRANTGQMTSQPSVSNRDRTNRERRAAKT